MGFGSIVANLMMFIAVLMLATGTVFILNIYVQETQDSLTEQKNRIVSEIRTDININSISYDNTTLDIYITNTGSIDLDMQRLDLFIDGERKSRSFVNKVIEEDTLITGPGIWSPREMLKVSYDDTGLAGNINVRLVTPNGVSDEDVVSLG